MTSRANVLFLDPYHTASHRTLALALRDRSRHHVTLLTLPARKWKWRMRGSALAFEPMVRALAGDPPDLLVTTDYLNLPEFLSLTRDLRPGRLPSIVYFHENQLTYPAASADVRDFHFGLVNLYSALAADRVLFNSEFHRSAFLEAVEDLVRRMPDFRPDGLARRILDRSGVLGLPLDLAELDAAKGPRREPWIVWNHRWEEDRQPQVFFQAMEELDTRAARGEAPDFRLAVVGQTYATKPPVFDDARARLARRIVRWGYVESRAEYLDVLARSAVVVSTSRHEFFGVSVMEAIHLGCLPLLPRRLTYPEIACGAAELLYDDPSEIPDRAAALLALAAEAPEHEESAGDPAVKSEPASRVKTGHAILKPAGDRILAFDLPRIVERWDAIIDEVLGR